MRVTLLEPLGVSKRRIEELSAGIRERGHEFVSFDDKTSDPDELLRRSSGADVTMIANNPLPASVIEGLPSLKMIAVAFTGIDHVGLDACKQNGITVCNCAGYSDASVAELTVGLTIDVLRHVVSGDAAVRSAKTSAGLMGMEIAGKTVGIVGTGRIGVQTGRLFAAFGAHVIGFARHENPKATAAGIEYVADLDSLLERSDIVSLHLPSNPATNKMFNAEKFALMPQGSVFVNCARGAIVDNDALADALNEGHLAGAGIDVFDMEPPIPNDYALLHAKNAVLTPHVAFLTHEAMERRAKIEFDNVIAWLDGEPKNVCTL